MRPGAKRWGVCGGAVLGLLLCAGESVEARTKLVTLPDWEKIRLDLKNPAYTLIEEERTINLQKGLNRIDFSWANVAIDKGSIQFRCIRAPGRVSVLNANYPPGENALFWEVSCEEAGPGVFRISYLINGIKREISYQAVADQREKNLVLDYFLTLKNHSGEQLEQCKIWLGREREFEKSLANGEAKRMLGARFSGVPVRKVYVCDPGKSGPHVRMYYRLINDRERGLGRFALESGKARIFQLDSQKTQAFLGEDWGAYTPLGSHMDLFLGLAKDVTIKRYVNREDRVNRRGVVYDLEREVRFEVENFKTKPVSVILKEHPGGEWVIKKVVLKEERGERNNKHRQVVAHRDKVALHRHDVNNLDVTFKVPPTKGDRKYQLYVTLVLKNRW